MTACSQSERDQFAEFGFVLGPKLLDENAAAELSSLIEAAVFDPEHPRFTGAADDAGQPFVHLTDLWRDDRRFEALIREPLLVAWSQALMQVEHLQLFEDRLFLKPPAQERVADWHRDSTYLPLHEPFRFVIAWVALADATEDNGAMWMIPGSHHPRSATDREPPAFDRETVMIDVPSAELCAVPRGHVHFHDPAVLHASGGNRTAVSRPAIGIQLVEAGARWDGSHPYASFFPGTDGHLLDPTKHPVLC